MKLLEVHLEVSDLARSEAFYTAILNVAKLIRFTDGRAVAIVLPCGGALGLWDRGKIGLHGGRGGEHVHFALQIEPEEYDSVLEKLKAQDAEVIEHVWDGGERSLYFFDPDGHQGEFMTTDWLRGSF